MRICFVKNSNSETIWFEVFFQTIQSEAVLLMRVVSVEGLG